MCGIVGYVGERASAGVLLDGLRRLEYRGYDSAGIAVHDGNSLRITRAVGKLDNLAQAISVREFPGTMGIGHTRWATHGRPSEANKRNVVGQVDASLSDSFHHEVQRVDVLERQDSIQLWQ